MKVFKDASFILLPYITLCAVLYHVAYWGCFRINGLAFIGLSDIIKSAVYPILSTIFAIVFQLSVQQILNDDKNGDAKSSFLTTKWAILIVFVALQALVIVGYSISNDSTNPTKWLIMGLINAILPSVFIANQGFLNGYFQTDRIRRFVIDIIVFLPVFSYYIGKYEGSIIQQNLSYKYTITQSKIANDTLTKSSRDTLKFLGNAERYFIFSDLRNIKLVFVKYEVADSLVLYAK